MAQSLPMLSNSSHKSGTYENACIRQARNRTGDVKFIVETQEIWAHRCVLAALSPKFDAQFYGSMSENGDIQIADVTAAAFNEFLQFFYTDEITLTVGNIDDVFNLAKQSLVENLVNQCTDFLLDTVELDNVCTYLQLAIFHNLKEIQKTCDKLIFKNSQALFETPEFLNCNRKVVIYILSLDTLRCKEIDVFEASMTCKEFTTIHQMHRGLFTTDEALELFHAIGDAEQSKSSSFNNEPRKSKPDPMSSQSLNIGSGLIDNRYEKNSQTDRLRFGCDKAISLWGFIICAGPFDDLLINIRSSTSAVFDHSKTIHKSNNRIKVMFGEPFEVPANDICLIDLTSLNGCFKLINQVLPGKINHNGVSLRIFQNDQTPTVFSQLMLDID